MYNITAPNCDPLADYDRVASAKSRKNQTLLAHLRPRVAQAYSTYVANGQAINSITPVTLAAAERTLLYSLFERLDANSPCKDIRSTLLAATKSGLCPYCRIHDATTLDHILERRDFPEFSVLRMNLAPCCERCNTRKQHNRNKAAGRPPFHLYFAGYPTDSFLIAAVDIADRGVHVHFELQRPDSYSKDRFAALERHFEAVELSSRYARRALSELRDRAQQMKTLHSVGGAQTVSDYLKRDAQSRAARWSGNDWLVVALQAAADSPDFCEEGLYLL
ncbi:MAG: hypothetical protein Q4G51_05955 [Dermatophilus congolensis]|nr:hypothetical protein [Dermatophilus congolensis]